MISQCFLLTVQFFFNAVFISHQRERIVSVSVGTSCSAAITRQGRLYTWGDNAAGQLGRREDTTTKKQTYDSATGGPGTAPLLAKDNHPPSTPGFPNSPPISSPASQRSTQQQQQLQSRSVSRGALYVDAHAPRDFGTPSRGSIGGGLGGVDGDVIGTSRFHTAGGQALAPLMSQSECNEDGDYVGENFGSMFSASPWQALTEGVDLGNGGKMLAMPAARFEQKYSNGGRSMLDDDEDNDEDDDDEDANPALHFMGHDGGGAPLRASYGRVSFMDSLTLLPTHEFDGFVERAVSVV